MTQQHGRRYEHDLVNRVDEITTDGVWVTTAGYSGNAESDDCDMVVTTDPMKTGRVNQYNVEAKKRNGKPGRRISNIFTGSKDGETGLEELKRLTTSAPLWAVAVVVLKMNRRKVMVIPARDLLCEVMEDVTVGDIDSRVEQLFAITQPRTTGSDNISMIKPETDDWPSATKAAEDAVVFAEVFDLPYCVSE